MFSLFFVSHFSPYVTPQTLTCVWGWGWGADLSHPGVSFKTQALSSVFFSSELEILFPPSLPAFHLQRFFFSGSLNFWVQSSHLLPPTPTPWSPRLCKPPTFSLLQEKKRRMKSEGDRMESLRINRIIQMRDSCRRPALLSATGASARQPNQLPAAG